MRKRLLMLGVNALLLLAFLALTYTNVHSPVHTAQSGQPAFPSFNSTITPTAPASAPASATATHTPTLNTGGPALKTPTPISTKPPTSTATPTPTPQGVK